MVHDEAEVVEALVAREHRGLPDLALLDLTVAEDGVGTVVLVPVLGGERHAHGSADALAERAGGHVDARGVVHVRVALQAAADVAQRLELLNGEEPAARENGVERGGRVALGEDEAVAVGLVGIGRVDVHVLEVQVGQDVRDGQRPAGVARLGGVNAGNDAATDLVRDASQLLVGHSASLSSV